MDGGGIASSLRSDYIVYSVPMTIFVHFEVSDEYAVVCTNKLPLHARQSPIPNLPHHSTLLLTAPTPQQ